MFEHSSKKEKTSGGKKKNTKKTPWIVIALTISWMMFFMIGMFSINATCTRESPIQSNEKGRNEQAGWPTKGGKNIWKEREIDQQEEQLTRKIWNVTVGNSQQSQEITKDQPNTGAAQARTTKIKE